MESSDSNESDRDEEQMSQNANSNSASVIVAGPTGVTGSRVKKLGIRKGLLKDIFQVLVPVLGGQVLVLVLGGSGPGGPCPCPGPWGSGPC